MITFYKLTIIAICYFCLQSCSLQSPEEIVAPETETYNSTIKSCDCIDNKSDDYRIEATINGEKLCFNKKDRPFKIDKWLKMDWGSTITMYRYNLDSTLKLSIQYYRPNFKKQALPYTIDKNNTQYCEVVEVSVLNFKPYKFSVGSTWDDSRFSALTSVTNLSVSIISFKDNIIEGTFAGDFYNGSPQNFKVTNGYFKTKLEVNDMRTAALTSP